MKKIKKFKIVEQIKKLIDERVKPAVIKMEVIGFVKFDNGDFTRT